MRPTKIYEGIAPRSRGGKARYYLWADENGALYVQIVENIIDAKSPGKHTDLFYRVSDYLRQRHKSTSKWEMVGFDPAHEFKRVADPGENNDVGFLSAILKHLFPNLM